MAVGIQAARRAIIAGLLQLAQHLCPGSTASRRGFEDDRSFALGKRVLLGHLFASRSFKLRGVSGLAAHLGQRAILDVSAPSQVFVRTPT